MVYIRHYASCTISKENMQRKIGHLCFTEFTSSIDVIVCFHGDIQSSQKHPGNNILAEENHEHSFLMVSVSIAGQHFQGESS